MNFKHLSDDTLIQETKLASCHEKNATLKLLEYLCEVDKRRAYANLGFSSLFEFVCKGLAYSESQSSERVNAVRLMRQNDEVKQHLETGKLTLTSAAQIQRFLTTEKKVTGALDETKKSAVILECLSLSKREVEKVLFSHASEPAKLVIKEKIVVVDPEHFELKVTLSSETEQKLNRAKELTKHESLSDLLDKALLALIEKEEKKMGKAGTPPAALEIKAEAKPPTRSRYVPIVFKKIIYARSEGRCEWKHPTTKERCRSRSYLQVDHVTPLAFGGRTEPSNLRHLCPAHNLKSAQDVGLGLHRKDTPFL